MIAHFHPGDYRDAPGPDLYDLAIYDPPFDQWDEIAQAGSKVEAHTYLCFTNPQNRRFVEQLFGQPRCELVWYFRDGRWVSHQLPRLTHEIILVYGTIPNEAYVGEVVTDRRPQRKGHTAIGKDKYKEERTYVPRTRKQLNSVIEVPRNVRKPLGVWSKPEPLVRTLLEWLLCPGAIIWDGFAGTMIFGKVASELGCVAYWASDVNPHSGEYLIAVREAGKRER